MKHDLHRRRVRYSTLSTQLAYLDNAHLCSLMPDTKTEGGWGRNHTIDIGSSKVFVKRIPVTDIEYQNMFSTANLYNLPTYYNYGIGSVGFGVFRELAMHIKTTNWVLEGTIETFPLMYHYRIMPFSGARAEVDMARHNEYVEYWGNNENIGRYILDRTNARYELVLFLEHIPYVFEPWLFENPKKLGSALDELRATIAFLRKHGIVHFDAHFYNILTDGELFYLTDFGLVLDRQFSLTEEETAFLSRHMYYDYGEVLSSLGFMIVQAFDVLSEVEKSAVRASLAIPENTRTPELVPVLLKHIEQIHAAGLLKLDPGYVAAIVKYRSAITLMQDFMSAMWANNSKDTPFPHARLQRILKETAFLKRRGNDANHPF